MTVLVTGGNGFLGKHVQKALSDFCIEYTAPSGSEFNLTDKDMTNLLVAGVKPNVILHMAATCGGIGANQKRPADFLHNNLKMASNIFDAALRHGVEYMYTLGSVCAYPKFCPVPFNENDLFNGYPEETNAPYGISKRVQLMMQKTYRQQYGLKGAHFIPVNMYGPQDHFDLENSHVIPALIRKLTDAKMSGAKKVVLWGTGTATREFLYVQDCAEALAKAIKDRLDYEEPINLGTGVDISILDLAGLIKELVGADVELVFDTTKPDGQPKRQLDVSRAREVLGFEAKTNLKTGLKSTIDWYRSTYQGIQ